MKLTKVLFILGLLVAFSFIIILFIANSLNGSSNSQSNSPPSENNPVTSNSSSQNVGNNSSTSSNSILLSLEEVAKHNSANNCWVIVNSKVYDLTFFINIHSGGSQQIVQFCGLDGSVGFNTKDGRGSHAARDMSILSVFYLGDLNQQITVSDLQSIESSIAKYFS